MTIKDGVAGHIAYEWQGEQGIVDRGDGVDKNSPPKRGPFVIVIEEDEACEPAEEGVETDPQVRQKLPNDSQLGGFERALVGSGIGLNGKLKSEPTQSVVEVHRLGKQHKGSGLRPKAEAR